jgi:heptosyltransferase-1
VDGKALNLRVRRAALGVLAPFVRPRRVPRETLRAGSFSRILVVRQDDRMGNLLFSTPLLAGLRARFPAATIDVVVSSRFREILEHHPAVARLIPVRRRGLARTPWGMLREMRGLRRHRYDLVIDAKPEPSLSNTIVVLLARGAVRIGFEHEYSRSMYSYTITGGQRPGRHESERLYALLAEIWDAPPCGPMRFSFPPGREPRGIPAGVSMHIGGHGGKRIPFPVLAGVARGIREAGHALTVFAGPDEEPVAAALEAEVPGLRVDRPRDVVELAHGIAGSRVFVGPDTGALHVASALEVPIANLVAGKAVHSFAPRSHVFTVVDFRKEGAVADTVSFVEAVLGAPTGAPQPLGPRGR